MLNLNKFHNCDRVSYSAVMIIAKVIKTDLGQTFFSKCNLFCGVSELFQLNFYRTIQISFQADSGGPLMFAGKNERTMVIGIVSTGIGCARKRLPGVYTRVSEFVPWIVKNTQSLWKFLVLKILKFNRDSASYVDYF